jgi:reactive intermediate/imine deaminase
MRVRPTPGSLLLLTLLAACSGRSGGVERIRPGGAATIAPYSPAVRAGGFVFFSGQIGIVPGGRTLAEGGVAGQTRQALANLDALLQASGVARADIVKCTVFLADIDDYGAMNEVYGEFFGETPPARSAFAVAGLPAGARVEIECIASQ